MLPVRDDLHHPPIWLRVIWTLVYILLSLWLGFILIRLPWRDAWSENTFFASYPAVRLWLESYFVRGAVSGLGILNLWIALWEAAHLGRRRA
jgi:hypothetical protein